jgi:hypothetical protein
MKRVFLLLSLLLLTGFSFADTNITVTVLTPAGTPATNPAITLTLLNCPSTVSPFDVVIDLAVSRTISFSVSNSTTGIVTATIPGNDVISCNLPTGETTVWQCVVAKRS